MEGQRELVSSLRMFLTWLLLQVERKREKERKREREKEKEKEEEEEKRKNDGRHASEVRHFTYFLFIC